MTRRSRSWWNSPKYDCRGCGWYGTALYLLRHPVELVDILYTIPPRVYWVGGVHGVCERLACKGIERPSYNPMDIEPMTGQGHTRSNDHTPCRTESEGGVINDDTKIAPCGLVCVGGIFEDEVWDGDVCEWLEKSGDDPHPEYPREFEGWWRSSSSSVEGENYRLETRLAVATVRIYSGSLLPFLATTVYPTALPHQSPH